MTTERWQLRRKAKPDALHLDFEVDPVDAPGQPVAMLRVLDTPEGLEVAKTIGAAAQLRRACELVDSGMDHAEDCAHICDCPIRDVEAAVADLARTP